MIEATRHESYSFPIAITLTIDEDLLAAAARATRIEDRSRLVEEGLRSLCRGISPAEFDFDATLRAAEALPDLADEDFEQLARHREQLAGLDALFASLQHRAFRGEL